MDVNGTKMSTRKVNVWRSEKWSNCINEPMKPNDWTFEWRPSLADECSTNPAGRVDELASGSICESNPHFGAFRSFSFDFESRDHSGRLSYNLKVNSINLIDCNWTELTLFFCSLFWNLKNQSHKRKNATRYGSGWRSIFIWHEFPIHRIQSSRIKCRLEDLTPAKVHKKKLIRPEEDPVGIYKNPIHSTSHWIMTMWDTELHTLRGVPHPIGRNKSANSRHIDSPAHSSDPSILAVTDSFRFPIFAPISTFKFSWLNPNFKSVFPWNCGTVAKMWIVSTRFLKEKSQHVLNATRQQQSVDMLAAKVTVGGQFTRQVIIPLVPVQFQNRR